MKNKKIFLTIGIILLGLLFLSPFYIVLVNSFKDRAQINLNVLAFPETWSLQYYTLAMDKMKFIRAFFNSVKVTAISIFFIVLVTSMCSWMLARTNTRLSKIIFFLFVSYMLVPFQSIMMPLMTFMGTVESLTGINMIDSHFGLIIMYIGFGTSMGVFLFHGFVRGIPISLEEAATIDGCNKFQLFFKVVLPLLKPIVMTVIILDVIWIWNDYLLPSLALSNINLRTIPLSTFYFFGEFTIQWNLAMAGLVLTMIPVLIFYITSQKYIVKGIAQGAIK